MLAPEDRLQAGARLSPAGQQAVLAGPPMLDHLDGELDALRREITAYGRAQRGCRACGPKCGVSYRRSRAVVPAGV